MQVNTAKIRGLMAEHGDTQQDLAKKLGITGATLRCYLKGKTQMRVDTVADIAKVYDVSPLSLLITEE